ncbi:Hypothetical protein BAAA_6000299 [Brucella abortus str. 2308 A]|nr:Hypothetical protein BAAA_6000299 [Brucella abortus str. 2308 A]
MPHAEPLFCPDADHHQTSKPQCGFATISRGTWSSFCFNTNAETALPLCFVALSNAKLLRTFAGNALAEPEPHFNHMGLGSGSNHAGSKPGGFNPCFPTKGAIQGLSPHQVYA